MTPPACIMIRRDDMKTRTRTRKLLSLLLTLAMVLSMIPAAVATGETATLVTDVTTLAVGDKVVIAAKNYDYALGTNQKTNNREAVAITKSEDSITLTDDV